MKKMFLRSLAAVSALGLSAGAMAQATGPVMTGLTDAVKFDTVITAVLSIAGMLAVVYVAVKGAQIGLAMLHGR